MTKVRLTELRTNSGERLGRIRVDFPDGFVKYGETWPGLLACVVSCLYANKNFRECLRKYAESMDADKVAVSGSCKARVFECDKGVYEAEDTCYVVSKNLGKGAKKRAINLLMHYCGVDPESVYVTRLGTTRLA